MDIQMPEMNGIEATEYIRKSLKNDTIKIVALSADVVPETRERIKAAGINDYITKPIDVEELFRTLVKWIEPTQKNEGTTQKNANDNPIDLVDSAEITYSEGLTRVADNNKLYRKLLGDFIQNNEGIVDEIIALLHQSEFDKAREKVHNLKGVSGNLGMKNLHLIATEIQKLVEEKIFSKELKNQLAQMNKTLNKIINELKFSLNL